MKQDTDKKTPELIEAIAVGGSYTLDADGKPVRDDANSTAIKTNAQVAEAAPGASAELNAAGGGVPPASAEASAARRGAR